MADALDFQAMRRSVPQQLCLWPVGVLELIPVLNLLPLLVVTLVEDENISLLPASKGTFELGLDYDIHNPIPFVA